MPIEDYIMKNLIFSFLTAASLMGVTACANDREEPMSSTTTTTEESTVVHQPPQSTTTETTVEKN